MLETELQRFLELPYRRIVYREENADGFYWVAEIEELGVAGDGDTPEEALRELEHILPIILRASLEDGAPIPEPATATNA
ncbi:MAG: type II toxin-antitoxin system HicB family antitoxin [Deinococcota bacterium]|jgi:predicted RNase H-like HicB family nuclease|nr:type II toxin-antitoxin system HicB family antitoxin [Deinococcota bacterium]